MTKERLEEIKDTQASIKSMIQQAEATSDALEKWYMQALASEMQDDLLRELTMEVECKWN